MGEYHIEVHIETYEEIPRLDPMISRIEFLTRPDYISHFYHEITLVFIGSDYLRTAQRTHRAVFAINKLYKIRRARIDITYNVP